MSTTPTLLANLRHLYENMVNGGVRDTASAKRIAKGLLSPAIAELERAALTQGAGEAVEPVAWMVWWGIGDMRPSWPPFETQAEAEEHASCIKSATEVRPVYAAPPAQQLQQAVARAVEECAQIGMLKAVNGIEVSAAIRAKGTHD